MSTIITTLVIIALLIGLTYMAKDVANSSRVPSKKNKKKAIDWKKNNPTPTDGNHPESPQIATKDELMRFWTDTMNNQTHTIEVRLRASELLGMYYIESSESK